MSLRVPDSRVQLAARLTLVNPDAVPPPGAHGARPAFLRGHKALLASNPEAAGEIVYVRRGSMLAARLGGKIGHADLDAAAGAGEPHVGDLALPDEPREVALDVPGDPCCLGEVHDSVSLRQDCGFDPGRRPLEGAREALGAEALAELLRLGADFGDCLVNGTA